MSEERRPPGARIPERDPRVAAHELDPRVPLRRPEQQPTPEQPATEHPGQGIVPPPVATQLPADPAYTRAMRDQRARELDVRSRPQQPRPPEEEERLRAEGKSVISKTLQNTLPPLRGLGGVGLFGCIVEGDPPLDPIDISDDVAAQYETQEMIDLGWVVGGGDAPPPEGGALSQRQETPPDVAARI